MERIMFWAANIKRNGLDGMVVLNGNSSDHTV